jgi:outer membrane protein OmpA-like peptidoglycan-associated protein
MTSFIDWPRYSRWTWIVAVLLFLLLLLLWLGGHGPGRAAACCGGSEVHIPPPAVVAPAPVQPAPPPVAAPPPKVPGTLKLAWDNGKLVLEGVVPDQTSKDRLLQAAIASYGDGNVIDKLTVDASRSASSCADKSDALFAALKNGPAIGIDCTADGVTLTGTVASDADRNSREQWAHDFFGASTPIVNHIEVSAPAQPVSKAEDVRCGDRISAAVTFATGSARIDATDRKLLEAIASCLKEGNYEIGGHTDNTGNAEANMRLSKVRAEAVRTYLIGHGVTGDHLTTAGYGSDHPFADNSTSEGRAQNRRIEFTKK